MGLELEWLRLGLGWVTRRVKVKVKVKVRVRVRVRVKPVPAESMVFALHVYIERFFFF